MRTPPFVEKCSVFIGASVKVGVPLAVGTAYLVNLASEIDGLNFVYLVTAKHIILNIKTATGVESVSVRFNMRTGNAEWVEFLIAAWIIDENSDIAIARIHSDLVLRILHSSFPLVGAVDSEYFDDLHVGPGDEVFSIGLFSGHPGITRIVPIVRIGNIAALNVERVQMKGGDAITGHLIEIQSIGGLSGSPVFVNALGNGQFTNELAGRRKDSPYALLGQIYGHWDVPFNATEPAGGSINAGIAVVTPVERLLELIHTQNDFHATEISNYREKYAATPHAYITELLLRHKA